MNRNFRMAAMATAATLTLAACSTGNEEPATGEAGQPAEECVIGMTQINQTATFFTQMNEGAQEAADEAGCELQIANANNDSAKQNSDIENFVSQKVTGLIVVAIDVNGVLPALEQASSQGIRTVAIDAELEEGAVDTFVGVDPKADTKVIGWDLTAEVISGIDSGLVTAVVQQDPRQEGVEAVNELAAILEGEEPAGFIDVPITIVTAENVDPYREIFE